MQTNNQIIKTIRSHVSNLAYRGPYAVHGSLTKVCAHSLRQMGWAFPVMSPRTMTKNFVFGFVAITWGESSRILFPDDSVFPEITGIAKPINELFIRMGCLHTFGCIVVYF